MLRRFLGSSPAAKAPDAADRVLHSFSPKDHWCERDACEGVQIFGATGTGKSSGSGRTLALAYLNAGFGGVVLAAKNDELQLWEKYCRLAGRLDDLWVLEPRGKHRFNFLDHEYNRQDKGGNLTYDVVNLFCMALESGEVGRAADPYWNDAVQQMLVNAIDLLALSGSDVTLPAIAHIIRTAPQSRVQAESKDWLSGSGWLDILKLAKDRVTGDDEKLQDLEETRAYWLYDFAGLAEKTRSIVVSSFMSKATGLLRSPLRQLFSTTTTLSPQDTHGGRIILVNLPIKSFGEVGRFAQVLFKTVWQRATERRTDCSRPVFLWADESQYFVTQNDMLFQQTARSVRASTVYLTQSVSNYYAMLEADGNTTAATDSLLGNLQTKIFHANGDPATNSWAERVFGQDIEAMRSTGMQTDGTGNVGHAESYHPVVPAIEFTTLKKGGRHNQFQVEAFVFQAGRTWSGGWNHGNAMRTTFDQRNGERD